MDTFRLATGSILARSKKLFKHTNKAMGTNTSKGMVIKDLPLDLFELILSWLSLVEASKCRLVNSMFRDIVDAMPRWKIDLTEMPPDLFKGGCADLSAFLTLRGDGLRQFAFCGREVHLDGLRVLRLLDQHCPALTHLDVGLFSFIWKEWDEACGLGMWARLTTMKGSALPLRALPTMTVLQRLEVELRVEPDVELTTGQLEKLLSLEYIREIHFTDVLKFATFSQTNDLDLKRMVMRGSVGQMTVSGNASEFPDLNIPTVRTIAGMFPTVDNLDVLYFGINKTLEMLSPIFPLITSLTVSRHSFPSSHPYEVDFAQMVNLKTLKVYSSSDVEHDFACLANCHYLEELSLHNCYNQTVDSIFCRLSPRAAITKLEFVSANLYNLAEVLVRHQVPMKILKVTNLPGRLWYGREDLEKVVAGFREVEEMDLTYSNLNDWVFDSILHLRQLRLVKLGWDSGSSRLSSRSTTNISKEGVLQFAGNRRLQIDTDLLEGASPPLPTLKLRIIADEWTAAPKPKWFSFVDEELLARARILVSEEQSGGSGYRTSLWGSRKR